VGAAPLAGLFMARSSDGRAYGSRLFRKICGEIYQSKKDSIKKNISKKQNYFLDYSIFIATPFLA
jgi:hypothetical protein